MTAQSTDLNQNRSSLHYPALDGLRGIAILSVVLYHIFGLSSKYFSFGWLGLDIFFVLSGFLITDILMRNLGEPHYLRNFYARRALRILPLYYIFLVLTLVLLPRLSNLPIHLDYYVTNQAWLWAFLQNWLYIFYPPTGESALNHLWSLAVEEQFYLVWPLLVLLLRRPRRLLFLMLFVLVSIFFFRFWIWEQNLSGISYYSLYTFSRIDGLCVGCMVALLQRLSPAFLSRKTSLIVFLFALINFLFYLFNLKKQDSFPYLALVGFTTFAMLIGLLVDDAVQERSPLIRRLLTIPPLPFLGKISFGMYIFHWPLYLILRPSLERFANRLHFPLRPELFASVAGCVLAVLAGYLSYRFIESPFLGLKRYFKS